MTKRIIIILLALTIFMIPLSGCQAGANKRITNKSITNIDGSKIKVPESPQKIAAVYGPAYESMVVLGVEDKVVVCADVQFQNFPWAKKVYKNITKLPYLKNVHSAVNMEELMRYHPDIVFTFPRPNEMNQLKKAGISAVPGITTGKFSDTKNQLTVYAQALGGQSISAAKAYEDYFDEKLAMVKAVTDKIPEDKRPSIYYAGIDMLTTYGKYSDIPELINDAGGMAVTAELEAGSRSQVSFEQLVKWNPDYIFIDHGGINDSASVEKIMENTYSDGRFGVISAVKNKQIYLSPSGVFYWDMGLQKILLLMQMAKILHPDKFQNLDIKQEIKTFYSKFYHYNLTDNEAEKILTRQNP